MSEDKLPSRGSTMFCALLSLAFLGLGVPGLLETIALHRSNGEVDARIVDSRVMSTRYGLSYEVKYVFQSALNTRSIGRKGLFYENLWSSLPEAEWKKVVEAGYVAVKYDPSNLRNNAPLVELPSLLDNSVPIVLGLFLSCGIVVVEAKRRRLPRTLSAVG